jgi:hypothetical protein
MINTYRTTRGKRFSEGARLAWVAKERRGLSNAQLAAMVGCDGATICRVLYGDRLPGRVLASQLQAKLKIPVLAWDQRTLSEEFVFPAARGPDPDDSGAFASLDSHAASKAAG